MGLDFIWGGWQGRDSTVTVKATLLGLLVIPNSALNATLCSMGCFASDRVPYLISFPRFSTRKMLCAPIHRPKIKANHNNTKYCEMCQSQSIIIVSLSRASLGEPPSGSQRLSQARILTGFMACVAVYFVVICFVLPCVWRGICIGECTVRGLHMHYRPRVAQLEFWLTRRAA